MSKKRSVNHLRTKSKFAISAGPFSCKSSDNASIAFKWYLWDSEKNINENMIKLSDDRNPQLFIT